MVACRLPEPLIILFGKKQKCYLFMQNNKPESFLYTDYKIDLKYKF